MFTIVEEVQNAITISNDNAKLDNVAIHHYLSKDSYWAQGIPIGTVKKAINNSLCFGVYDGAKQIGFARMITDVATFAYLADVYILEEYRGKGLSKWLMRFILKHPDLQGLRRYMLATRDAQGLYLQFGFKQLANPENIMEIRVQDIYQKLQ